MRVLSSTVSMAGASLMAPKTHNPVRLRQTSHIRPSFSLISRLESAKELNRNVTIEMARKGWSLTRELKVLDLERNVFVFQFTEKQDFLKVLRGRPWSIQSHLLNLQLWEEDMVQEEVNVDLWPIWVQFHGLPFCFLNRENALDLGSMIGKVVAVENPRDDGKLVRKVLRARVLLNVNDPLMTGFLSKETRRPRCGLKPDMKDYPLCVSDVEGWGMNVVSVFIKR